MLIRMLSNMLRMMMVMIIQAADPALEWVQ